MLTERHIGTYEILEVIASGSQGVVYRAHDSSGRLVALKVLHPHLASDHDYAQRFQREATIASSINHPNVVKVFEIGQDGESYFIAMEYLPVSLRELHKTHGRVSVDRALEITHGVCCALEAAWTLEIVHRDINPQNILLAYDGTVKVVDFGIARAMDFSSITNTGMILGTPHYMAPEQAQGSPADIRSDLYSLGLVLSQILTETLSLEAHGEWEIIRQLIKDGTASIQRFAPELPEGVLDLVNRLLAQEPDDRFQTPTDLRLAIEQLRGTLPDAPTSRFLRSHPVLEEIASGARAVVYRTKDIETSREIAVKVLHPELGEIPSCVEGFLRRAEVATQMDPAFAVQVLEYGQDGDQCFVAMDYMPRTLRQHVREQGRLSVRESLRIAVDLCRGLEGAERLGMVHLRLKPENIALTEAGGAKIADFGIAEVEGIATVASAEPVTGTPGYMAPEQAHGTQADIRADLYAVGVILFEMVNGSLPTEDEERRTQILKDSEDQTQIVAESQPDVPASVHAVLQKALAAEPEQRYQTPQEMRMLLQHALAMVATDEVAVSQPVPAAPGRRFLYRLAIASLALGAVTVLGGIYLVLAPYTGWPFDTSSRPPSREVEVAVQPTLPVRAFVVSDDGGSLEVLLPAGTVGSLHTLIVSPLLSSRLREIQPAAGQTMVVPRAFEVRMIDGDNQTLENVEFDGMGTLAATYTEEDVAGSAGDPSRLRLLWFNEGAQEWEVLPTAVNPATRKLIAQFNRLSSIFGIGVFPTPESSPGSAKAISAR